MYKITYMFFTIYFLTSGTFQCIYWFLSEKIVQSTNITTTLVKVRSSISRDHINSFTSQRKYYWIKMFDTLSVTSDWNTFLNTPSVN